MANAAQPAMPAATNPRAASACQHLPSLIPDLLSQIAPRMAVRAKSTAGPATKKMSCSRTIAMSAPHRPSATAPDTRHSPPDVQPHRDEQRHRERRARVGERRRDVHIKEERRADPDGNPGRDRPGAPGEPPRRRDREENRREPEHGGSVRDRGDVRFREPVHRHVPPRRAHRPRRHVADRVERRPQHRAPHRAVVLAQAGGGCCSRNVS